MKRRKLRGLFQMLSYPTAGIGKDKKTSGSGSTKVKIFEKVLAKNISKKRYIYRKGRANSKKPEFFTSDEYFCPKPIISVQRFLKENVEEHQRHEITEKVTTSVISYWRDPYYGYTHELPNQDRNYVLMRNGYYDMYYGEFREFKLNKKENPGDRRFLVNATYVEETPGWVEELAPILPSWGQPVTGVGTERGLIWNPYNNINNFLIELLRAVFPDSDAYQYLFPNSPTPDYQKAAESDCHCIIVKVASASELTESLWKKLLLLSERKMPVLIVAEFLPFLPPDCDALAKQLQKCLYIVPESMNAAVLPAEVTEEVTNALVSSAIRELFHKINAIEPDTCPEVDEMFSRPDPNDVRAMLEWLFAKRIIHTAQSSDAISVQDITVRLKEINAMFGGDPEKYTVNGIGKYLKDLGIKKEERKFPTTKGKVSVVVGYKWINESEV